MDSWGLNLIGAVLVHNYVLVQFLGLCPFVGVSQRLDSSLGLGLATTFVLTLTSSLCFAVEQLLLRPLGLQPLRTLSFIVCIAGVVQLLELLSRRHAPLLHQILGLYLPLITSNCIVLGVALLVSRDQPNLFAAMLNGLGAGLGFALALMLFAGLRERLADADIPLPFRGAPIALICAGIMALAFMGFAGMER